MKTKILILLLLTVQLLAGCKKDSDNRPAPEPPMASTGSVMFWSDDYVYRWGIKLDGVDRGSVGQSHTEPNCGDTYFQNFTLSAGKHIVFVYAMTGGLASGLNDTITISPGGCLKKNIH